MVKEEVKRILATGTQSEEGTTGIKFNDVIKLLCVEKVDSDVKKKNMEEYGLKHAILQQSVRPDRQIKKDGQLIRTEKVARIILAYQKKIVEYAVAFLFGKPINLESPDADKALFEKFKEVWVKKLKMDNVLKDVARKTMIEQESAILFYPDLKEGVVMENGEIKLDEKSEPITEVKARKLRTRVLCLENGDEIFPYFDEYGDLEAFTRKYTTKDVFTKKSVICYDIYFDDLIIFARKVDKDWRVTTKPNIMGKIPVVYFYQKEKEWNDVQILIDREEMHSSKHADTNDYFGSPAVVSKGKLKSAPEKGDVAKFFQMEGEVNPQTGKMEYGDIDYLTYDKDTESVKQEHDLNNERIHSFTSTPNITLDTLKSLGNTSGVALEIMFYDPMLKAQNKQEIFGTNIERCINLLKVMIGTFLDLGSKDAYEKLNVEFQFSNPLPNNITELIDVLSVAVGGKAIMAQEDAVSKNPLVTDKQKAISNLQNEVKQEQELNSKIEQSYN
jgi:SPP1 family phage portal protein